MEVPGYLKPLYYRYYLQLKTLTIKILKLKKKKTICQKTILFIYSLQYKPNALSDPWQRS